VTQTDVADDVTSHRHFGKVNANLMHSLSMVQTPMYKPGNIAESVG